MSVKSDSIALGKFVGAYLSAWVAAASFVLPWVMVIHIYQFGYPMWLWALVPAGWISTWFFAMIFMRVAR